MIIHKVIETSDNANLRNYSFIKSLKYLEFREIQWSSFQETWLKNQLLTCKHIIATKICQVIMKCAKEKWPERLRETVVSDGTFYQMLIQMD